TSSEKGLRLDLSLPELLGKTPVGKFEVVVRCSLGQSYHFGLRLVPELNVDGLGQLYLTNADEMAMLRFECDLSTQIRQNPPQEGVDLKPMSKLEEHQEYRITAVPGIRQVNLQLRHDCGVVMPLAIPIHRLRWGLSKGKGEDSIYWQ